MPVRLPTTCLVVLVGPAGAGKSTWADRNFRRGQVVSSDELRAAVGESQHDQRASADAFAVLFDIVERRLDRGLLTVVDTLGIDDDFRRRCLDLAATRAIPCFAVAFDTPPAVCRKRNAARPRSVPKGVLDRQLAAYADLRPQLDSEPFEAVLEPDRVILTNRRGSMSQTDRPMKFGLSISSFEWDGGASEIGDRLAAIAQQAEDAGFTSLWVMDHFRQIPQIGRPWLNMPEAYTTLAWLAGRTTSIQLGTLVTGVTYRNPAHLAKIIATLDVLSGGRARCGLGAAWEESEHAAYGWEFPDTKTRLDMVEDTLQILRLMWGPGTPPFEGKTISIAEAMCYPRPLQDSIPILVGGGGEKRTLRLVARYADECNLMGPTDVVERKIAVLHEHCREVGRDPNDVSITHFAPALVAGEDRLAEVVARLRPEGTSPETFFGSSGAGTPTDLIARYSELAAVGVSEAMVGLASLDDPHSFSAFAEVITAFN